MSTYITNKEESIDHEFSTTCTTNTENNDKQTSSYISYEQIAIGAGVGAACMVAISMMPAGIAVALAGGAALVAEEVANGNLCITCTGESCGIGHCGEHHH